MKLKRILLSACAAAFATCVAEPQLVQSVVPAGASRILSDPLALLERRSPGARDDSATIDTKHRRTRTAALGHPPLAPAIMGRVPSPPLAIASGPFAISNDGPSAPGIALRGMDSGLLTAPGGDEPGYPGGDGGLHPGHPNPPGGGGSPGGGETPCPPSGGPTPPPKPPCCGPGGGGDTPVPTPEPEAWAMLILGFAITGAAMRLRSSRASNALA